MRRAEAETRYTLPAGRMPTRSGKLVTALISSATDAPFGGAANDCEGNVTAACWSVVNTWPAWETPSWTAMVPWPLVGGWLLFLRSDGGVTQWYGAGGAKPSKNPGATSQAAQT